MRPSQCLLLALASLCLFSSSTHAADQERQVYIVYMGDQHLEDYSAESLHLNLLNQVLESSSPRECLVYSYKRSFNGFAAKLTDPEQKKLAGMGGIVSVFPSTTLKLQTTRSWDFLGFTETAKRNLALERDVIVGMLDTGIWPESESFSDEGFGPPPKRWKGACVNFTCNNKIIGARYYHSSNYTTKEEPSPRDFEGHGTHTASTAAGRAVGNASLYGLARGTARGAVPSARIAVYKVCWEVGCESHDVLAAYDDAIADGVDVVSLSLGGGAQDYFEDVIAIGSFHAMKKGILTSAAAGNDGSLRGSVANVAPWMMTVAASSIDRRIMAKLALGNNETILGPAVNTFPTQKKFYPFDSIVGPFAPIFCEPEKQNRSLMRGKIILCSTLADGSGALEAELKGLVMSYDSDSAHAFPLPAVVVSHGVLDKLQDYISTIPGNSIRNAKLYIEMLAMVQKNSALNPLQCAWVSNPVAKIHTSEDVFNPKAPVIASFSSRGPNRITPDILKPDLTAPGLDILAAWSPKAKLTDSETDKRSVKYNIISGTSMSCPHATGVAAYVKSFHPKWSPAAIKSALMTTASPMNPSYPFDAELSYGAGQVNPIKARSPGLVYDATVRDFADMLCHQGYNMSMIRLITGDEITCPKDAHGSAKDLNYPSMSAKVQKHKSFRMEFPRIVTNVGRANSIYRARIKSGSRLNVTVNPGALSFTKLYEKRKYVVTVSGRRLSSGSVASASIVWSDGKHRVRSPICVYTDEFF